MTIVLLTDNASPGAAPVTASQNSSYAPAQPKPAESATSMVAFEQDGLKITFLLANGYEKIALVF